jgi:glycosyltransferase involved in cell wall biosynthesis
MPVASVIIPTYNRAHLVGATLRSVCAQTFPQFEILVVDDGSTDGTEELLAGLRDRVVYRRVAHGGASAARNAGLEMARGEYVAFLDSDDLWDPRFLEATVGALIAAPRAGFVYCDYSIFDGVIDEQGSTQVRCLKEHEKLRGNLFAALLRTDFLCTGGLLVRRDCFGQIGIFDPALPVAQDWDLWLRLALRYEAGYVDEPLLKVRSHTEQISRDGAQVHADNVRIMGKLRREHGPEVAPYLPIVQRNLARSYRALAGCQWRAGRPLSALGHGLRMLAAWLP